MKYIKRLLLIVVVLVVLILITALFVEQDTHVERSVIIAKPKSEVFDYLRMLRNQNDYSVWNKMDPKSKKWYKGTDGTVGFISAWDSKNDDVGAGEQEIMRITSESRIDLEVRFKRPFESVGKAHFELKGAENNGTEVTWSFDSHSPYPFNIMLLFMDMDAMLGKDLEKGLENAKTILESQKTVAE